MANKTKTLSKTMSASRLIGLPFLLAVSITGAFRHFTLSTNVGVGHELHSRDFPQDSVLAYARLMAPIVFPQIYPSCGRIQHPPLPQSPTEAFANASKSQDKEDMALFDMFFKDNLEPGVFLEIGALNGITYSNTYSYEHALGWRGILVEANPQNAAGLRTVDRPRSAKFSVAACGIADMEHPGQLTFTKKGGPVAAAVDYASPHFMDAWKELHGDERVPVPCVPLQFIIDATGLLDIDFFSLDVEGSERIVLETVDLERTNIRVLLVELDGSNKEKEEWIQAHLANHDFVPFSFPPLFINRLHSAIFVNQNFERIKASRPPLPIQC
jgi:FkbM family methyltransferase